MINLNLFERNRKVETNIELWIIEGYLIFVWVKVPSHYFNITIAYYQQKYEKSLSDHAVQISRVLGGPLNES